MSTIIEKLQRLARYKEDIKSALFKVGVEVSDNMAEYADAILNMPEPYRCNIVIKDRKSIAVSEKLIGLDLTKYTATTRDNMGYQYPVSQVQTDTVIVNFIITHISPAIVMATAGYKFCIQVDGGEYDKMYLSLLPNSNYKFSLSDEPKYWYSNMNPTITGSKIQVYEVPTKLKVWKTDTDAVGQKVYANGESATDGIIKVGFVKRT